jgi:rhamnose transport system permease protein
LLKRLLTSREARCLGLLLLALIIGASKTSRLLEADSLSSIELALPIMLVVAIGQMPVIVSRGIDLSVGSTLAMGGLMTGALFRAQPHISLIVAVLVALIVGLALGLLNGSLVVWGKIPPIIATLGTLSAYRGLAFVSSGSKEVDSSTIPSALTDWSQYGPIRFGGVTVPWLLLLAVACACVVAALARYHPVGRDLYAIGSNPEAAQARGIKVNRALWTAYGLCGALSGLAGLMYASRFGFVNPGTAGRGIELTAIAAAVIGGCDVRGGTGSALGVFLGCCLLAVIGVALAVLGIAADCQVLAYGFIIVTALALDSIASRRAAGAAA